GAASSGGLRMVRDPELDRRRGHQHSARDSMAHVAQQSLWHADLLHDLLGHQPARDSEGHRVHPIFAGLQRADPAGRGALAAGVGWEGRRRLRAHPLLALAIPQHRGFLKFLIPALNGTVGFWSTVSLNIPDFTRFARNERGQAVGQAIALPLTMTLYSFIGVAGVLAPVVIFGACDLVPARTARRCCHTGRT